MMKYQVTYTSQAGNDVVRTYRSLQKATEKVARLDKEQIPSALIALTDDLYAVRKSGINFIKKEA